MLLLFFFGLTIYLFVSRNSSFLPCFVIILCVCLVFLFFMFGTSCIPEVAGSAFESYMYEYVRRDGHIIEQEQPTTIERMRKRSFPYQSFFPSIFTPPLLCLVDYVVG